MGKRWELTVTQTELEKYFTLCNFYCPKYHGCKERITLQTKEPNGAISLCKERLLVETDSLTLEGWQGQRKADIG